MEKKLKRIIFLFIAILYFTACGKTPEPSVPCKANTLKEFIACGYIGPISDTVCKGVDVKGQCPDGMACSYGPTKCKLFDCDPEKQNQCGPNGVWICVKTFIPGKGICECNEQVDPRCYLK